MRPHHLTVFALFFIIVLTSALTAPARAADPKSINICKLVSADEIAKLYRKKLVPNQEAKGCYWSKKPNSMAYLHIGVHKYRRELRKYFSEKIPPHVQLKEIKDLGDGGYMTIAEGALGVIVVKKGNHVLQSAVTFLDIKPGSDKHKLLWKIYKRILDKLD
ncbi:MAG: hypothetical protein PVG60_02760 [Desulfarculaceae bacterium]|jgi:hypothetical protein